MTTTATVIAETWVDGFLIGLRAAGIDESRHAEILDQVMPEQVRHQLALNDARNLIQGLIDSGRLIRTNHGLIEADQYDPAIHGPKDGMGLS